MAQWTLAGYSKVIMLAVAVVSSGLIISVFVIPFLTQPVTTGDGRADARRLVVIIDGRGDDPPTFRHVKVSDKTVEINSMQWTADPFGRSMRTFYDAGINSSATEEKNAWVESMDAQERYMLVRLPKSLGGAENDISAYRAFSAFDIASHCTIRYWGGDRMLIQDPCHSNGYRAWDGLTMHGISVFGGSGGAGMLFSSDILGLPQMRLGVDSEGYVVAYKPDNSLYGDGVVGEGKRFTPEQMEESNMKMIQAVGGYMNFKLPFPPAADGKPLVWLVPGETGGYMNSLFVTGHSFEGYEKLSSAVYEPRPLSEEYPSYRITALNHTVTDEAKATFDDLFGVKSPECDQGCRFVIRHSDNMIARIDTEALDGEALVWGRTGDQNILVAIEGDNSGMEELVQIANSLNFDHGL